MKNYPIVQLGEVLERNLEQIRIEDNKKYKQVTVRLWGKGVQLRNEVYGHEIKSNIRYIVKSGQFIISKIDARNGASGLIPDELDGAVITGDFLSYNINTNLIIPEYLLWLSRTNWFLEQCIQASSGTTNRVRLNESKFLQIGIPLPDISEQVQIIEKIQKAFDIINEIETVFTEQKKLLEKLRQGILQKAVQGQLVEQDPNDEPAAELLKRILEQKERLTKEKKIKKEKPLPPITPEEIPYELPKGWEWVRLGSIITFYNGYAFKSGDYAKEGIGLVKIGNIYAGGITEQDMNYIPESIACELSRDYFIEPGDLLIAMSGATTGKLGFNNTNKIYLLNQRVGKIVPIMVHKKYLFYYLETKVSEILNRSAGSAIPNLSTKEIENILVPLPPLNEQLRIVSKIDGLFELCWELEKQIEMSKQDCELFQQTVLQELLQNH